MLDLPTEPQNRVWQTSWRDTAYGVGYASALCLVVIQFITRLITTLSQTDTEYRYSVSACITVSDSIKLILSTCFFYIECRKRERGYAAAHASFPSTSSPRSSTSTMELMDKEEDILLHEDTMMMPYPEERKKEWRRFFSYILKEVSTDAIHGFTILALLYALINNTARTIHKLKNEF